MSMTDGTPDQGPRAGGSAGATGEADDDVVDAEIVDEEPAEGAEGESK